MFHSVLQFQFVLATSARNMLIYTSREALSIDSRDEGVHAKQILGGIKSLQDYYHDRKRKFSFGALTHSSCIGQKMPKAMELLKCYFNVLYGYLSNMAKRPQEKVALTLRQTCVQNRLC